MTIWKHTILSMKALVLIKLSLLPVMVACTSFCVFHLIVGLSTSRIHLGSDVPTHYVDIVPPLMKSLDNGEWFYGINLKHEVEGWRDTDVPRYIGISGPFAGFYDDWGERYEQLWQAYNLQYVSEEEIENLLAQPDRYSLILISLSYPLDVQVGNIEISTGRFSGRQYSIVIRKTWYGYYARAFTGFMM